MTRKRKHAQPDKPCLETMFQEDPFLLLCSGDVVPGRLHQRGQPLRAVDGREETEKGADYSRLSAWKGKDASTRTGTRRTELCGLGLSCTQHERVALADHSRETLYIPTSLATFK